MIRHDTDFAALCDLLGEARSRGERELAVLATIASAGPELADWLRPRAHRLIRGGARTLLREALEQSPTEHVADHHDGSHQVRLRRGATTRPAADGRRLTVETGLAVRHVAFAPSGDGFHGYGEGELPHRFDDVRPPSDDPVLREWSLCDRPLYSPGRGQDWWFDWSNGGELRMVDRLGRCRDDHGVFAVSPDGRRVAVSNFRDLTIHALPDLAERARFTRYDQPRAIAFVDDQRVLAFDGAWLALVDSTTGELITSTCRANEFGGIALAVSREGRHRYAALPGRGAAGGSITVCIYDLGFLDRQTVVHPLDGGSNSTVAGIDVDPTGRWLVTAHLDGGVHLWDLAPTLGTSDVNSEQSVAGGLVPVVRLGTHPGGAETVRFAGERIVVTGGGDGSVIRWDPVRPDEPHLLGTHAGAVTSLDTDGSGSALTGSTDGTVIVWNLFASSVAPPPLPVGLPADRAAVVELTGPGLTVSPDPVVDRFGSRTRPGPSLIARDRSGAVVDVVAIDAEPVTMAVTGPASFAVVDTGGHLTCWHGV